MNDVSVQTDDVSVDVNDGYTSVDISDDGYTSDGYSSDFTTSTGTSVTTDDIDPAAAAALAGFGFVAFIVWLAVIVLMIVSSWKIYAKAGQPGWASIIPIYNLIVLLQIVQKPLWWIVLLFIPFVNFVVIIMIYHELSKAFGKGVGFTIGMIFLSIIFFPILAFGSATYQLRPMVPAQPTPPPIAV